MTDPLEKLFGNPARVRLLRLFLFNPQEQFSVADAAQRARTSAGSARKELNAFHALGLVRRARRSAPRYGLNADFAYLSALQNLLLNAPARGGDIAQALRGAGTLKLIVAGGIFVGQWDGRLDVLIVGDRLNERKVRTALRRLESEIGKELRYATLATGDFLYRLNMNDKLVRDVMDYPHKIVFDRLDIGLK
jgi:hypothetical protein